MPAENGTRSEDAGRTIERRNMSNVHMLMPKRCFIFAFWWWLAILVQPSHCSLAKSSEFEMGVSEISKPVLEFPENFKLLLIHQNSAVHLGSFCKV